MGIMPTACCAASVPFLACQVRLPASMMGSTIPCAAFMLKSAMAGRVSIVLMG